MRFRRKSPVCISSFGMHRHNITRHNKLEFIVENQKSEYGGVQSYSLCAQTTQLVSITIVDDGSTDENSINILDKIKQDFGISVPVIVIKQMNGGVSAARNAG